MALCNSAAAFLSRSSYGGVALVAQTSGVIPTSVEHNYLDWPDFGVPQDAGPVFDALGVVRDRARAGQRVEIGWLGGHGRTGTALASLAVLSGEPAQEAVAWVRTNFCSKAIETPEQAAFVPRSS
jgi:protein-tyrosine phosphatase